MRIRDVMTTNVEVIDPNARVTDAARKMRELNVGALPVCDGQKIHGVVTDRDIAMRCVAEGHNPNNCTIDEAMSRDVIYAYEEDSVEEAAQLMRDRQIRRLYVLDRNKEMTGVVALGDLAIEADDQTAASVLQGVSQPSERAVH